MLSDIEIANAATLQPIRDVAAATLGISEEHLVPYGHHKAKVDLAHLASLADRPLGRLAGRGSEGGARLRRSIGRGYGRAPP